MTSSLQEIRKKGTKKSAISIIILAFLTVPILTTSILYMGSENFRNSINSFFAGAPGKIGAYFSAKPTKEETEALKKEIAKHYITLEEERLVDKMRIIKNEDSRLFNDLILLLNRENPVKMKRVKEMIRNAEMKSDLFQRILEEIEKDKKDKVDQWIKYLASLKLHEGIVEIEKAYENGELTVDELVLIFENLKIDQSTEYLRYMDQRLVQKIRFRISPSIAREIDKKSQQRLSREGQLIQLAKVYESKDVKELREEIGTLNKFNIGDLSLIYYSLSIEKGAQVLSSIEDADFLLRLYEGIHDLARISKDEGTPSVALAQAVEVYREYNRHLQELLQVYQRMGSEELARIIDQLITSNQEVIKREVAPQQIIILTSEQLAVDILKGLKPKVIADLMQYLKTEKAITISKKIIQQ